MVGMITVSVCVKVGDFVFKPIRGVNRGQSGETGRSNSRTCNRGVEGAGELNP